MKIRKAILTGGGRGTRLRPLTSTINKHLLPLANKPMIFHAIERIAKAGIEEIFINTNPGETSLQEVIGDGGHWGIKIQYYEQRGGPLGLAHAIYEGKSFIGDDPFLAYLGDNILIGDVSELLQQYSADGNDCLLATAKVDNPSAFGVPEFAADGSLKRVIEKPAEPPCDLAVIGVYIYGPKMFFDAFDTIEKSARGEYEISDVHTALLNRGKRVGLKEVTGWWKDTGKPNDLLLANNMLLDAMQPNEFVHNGTVDSSVELNGHVYIGTGSRIGKNAVINGPVIIGENCVIENATIGPYVTIGHGSEMSKATITTSILLENVRIVHNVALSESLIGKGAEVVSAAEQKEHPQQMVLGDKARVVL